MARRRRRCVNACSGRVTDCSIESEPCNERLGAEQLTDPLATARARGRSSSLPPARGPFRARTQHRLINSFGVKSSSRSKSPVLVKPPRSRSIKVLYDSLNNERADQMSMETKLVANHRMSAVVVLSAAVVAIVTFDFVLAFRILG